MQRTLNIFRGILVPAREGVKEQKNLYSRMHFYIIFNEQFFVVLISFPENIAIITFSANKFRNFSVGLILFLNLLCLSLLKLSKQIKAIINVALGCLDITMI